MDSALYLLLQVKTMHDYWNDPPETPEMPECCDQEMTVDKDGNCICELCVMTFAAQPDIEPPDLWFSDEEIEIGEKMMDEAKDRKWEELQP